MSKSTLYLIRDTETAVERLVRARNKSAALRFVMKPLTIAAATPEQLVRAHTDPELYRRWVGPDVSQTTIDYWDARTGGSWRFLDREHALQVAP